MVDSDRNLEKFPRSVKSHLYLRRAGSPRGEAKMGKKSNAKKKCKLDDAYVDSLTSPAGAVGWQTGPVTAMAIDEPEAQANPSSSKGDPMQMLVHLSTSA